MGYCRPKIDSDRIAYKGRRYWVISLVPNEEFDGFNSSDGDYSLWDGKYGATIAIIRENDGEYIGEIISHVDMGSNRYSSLRSSVKGLSIQIDRYCKSLGI